MRSSGERGNEGDKRWDALLTILVSKVPGRVCYIGGVSDGGQL